MTQSRATDLILPYEVEKDVSDTDSEVERRVGAGITLTDGPCHRSAGGVGGGEQGVGTGGGAADRDVAAVAHWCGVWERHCVLGPRAVRWVLCNRGVLMQLLLVLTLRLLPTLLLALLLLLPLLRKLLLLLTLLLMLLLTLPLLMTPLLLMTLQLTLPLPLRCS